MDGLSVFTVMADAMVIVGGVVSLALAVGREGLVGGGALAIRLAGLGFSGTALATSDPDGSRPIAPDALAMAKPSLSSLAPRRLAYRRFAR